MPRVVGRPFLFGSAVALSQSKLFRLEGPGDGGWLKSLRLEDYVPRTPRPELLQQALFSYHEAWG